MKKLNLDAKSKRVITGQGKNRINRLFWSVMCPFRGCFVEKMLGKHWFLTCPGQQTLNVEFKVKSCHRAIRRERGDDRLSL